MNLTKEIIYTLQLTQIELDELIDLLADKEGDGGITPRLQIVLNKIVEYYKN